MFGLFKNKAPTGTPLEQVRAFLAQMGYELVADGEAVAQQRIDEGLSPAEVAAEIVYTTMAYDLKHAGTTATASLRFRPVATGILNALDEYRDNDLMSEQQHQLAYEAIVAVNAINEQQLQWIEKVLAHPLLGKQRLANNTGVLKGL